MTDRGWGLNEDETCRRFVLPALTRAGWTDTQISPQYQITDGKIVATAKRHQRDTPLRADYVLEYRPGLAIGVIEAKRTRKHVGDGVEQAKRYALRLDLPFAFATNGRDIFEVDLSTGLMKDDVPRFPSPEELWSRYRAAKGIDAGLQNDLVLAPFDQSLRNWDNTPKRPRYYQRIAVNRAVQAIARGDKRVLLTLATGTGKTLVAFLIVAKLWESQWPEGRRPRVLYLADRNILVDQPKDDYFAPKFSDAVHKLGGGEAKRGRNIYFALYQSLAQGDERALFRQFPADHFDLVIVDECHRGSARESSQWRPILEHYATATQIGLTATPIRQDEVDTYNYFGEPVYEYSLAQGIEDGFLAPYRVRKVRLNIDMTGWQPEPGQQDKYGNEIPDKLYGPRDYERVLAILERTDEAARYLTEYLHRTNPMGKTVVFCEDTDHAHRVRTALNNANAELVRKHPTYVVGITDRDGPPGKAHLDEFRRIDTDEPVIAVTSRLLSTGVDMPAVRNIVLFRRIGSMSEFKQIIGRGTRLCEDAGKLTFDIVDFVEATRLFNDPAFDGPPMRITREETDETGHLVDVATEGETEGTDYAGEEEVAEPGAGYEEQDGGLLPSGGAGEGHGVVNDPDQIEEIRAEARRLYVDGVDVYVWGEALYVVEGDGRRLRLVEYRQFVKEQVLKLDLSPTDLRGQWARAKSRKLLTDALAGRGVDFRDVAERLGQPEADSIDLLLHVAWELPVVTREERSRRVEREHREFLAGFGPEAREILLLILEKYTTHGAGELSPAVLRVSPFTGMGSVTELAARFGGPDKLRTALDALSELLFDIA